MRKYSIYVLLFYQRKVNIAGNKFLKIKKSGAPLHSSKGYATITIIVADYFAKSIILCDLRITLIRLTPFDKSNSCFNRLKACS